MKNILKEYLADLGKNERLLEQVQLFEHETYKSIPGTKSSYRQDTRNVTTNTLKHSHVYAKSNGGGNELYAVNTDGSGHDGSSGVEISSKHADYFRSLGYKINPNNILESIDLDKINNSIYSLIIIENA
jgi:hypothetical protein